MTYRSGYKALAILLSITFFFIFMFSTSNTKADNNDSLLGIGSTVNRKIRNLSTKNDPENKTQISLLKAIRMAESLPKDFVPSNENTVSTVDSSFPIYIFFENEKDVGIIYFYTEGSRIIMNPDSSLLFANFPSLADISGVADWDASHVKNMYALFSGAASLTDALALKNWDTSNVTDMGFMFSGASSLMFIDVSNWNTKEVTSMLAMFQVGDNYMGNGELVEILGLGNWDVSNVTDMTCMFYGAGKMTHYDIAGWNVSKVESMNHMFCDNFQLRSLDLSSWDVSSLKTVYCMFDDAKSLKTIGDVSHWNTVNLIDAGGWLNYATSFIGDNSGVLDLSGWNTSNLKTVGEMFLRTKIRMIDLTGWTFDSIINTKWEGAGHGIYYEYGNGNGKEVQGFGQMFKKTPNLLAVYVSESGLESFNAAVEREVNIEEMWTDSKCAGFTVK